MNNLFRTTLEFLIKDNATAGLNSVTKAASKAGKQATSTAASFKNLAGAFTALVVAKHIKNVLLSVIEPARKMEQAMMRLAFTMGKAGPMDKSVQALRANAEKVAEFTVFGQQEAMEATVMLNRALRDTNATMKATKIAAGLAQASFGKMTLEKSTAMVGQMAKAFGFGAEQIKIAGDKIFAVARHTGTGVENFAGIMGRLAMAGKLGEQSFEGMIKAFSLINRLIPNAKSASNLMVSMMAKMSDPKTQEAIAATGVSVMDAQMRIKPLTQILLELAQSAKISSVGVRMALTKAFGARQIKPLTAMLGALQAGIKGVGGETLTGAQLLAKIDQVMAGASGTLDEGINRSMQTAHAQILRANVAWTKFKTVLGEKLLPILKPLAESFADLIGFIMKVSKALAEIPGVKEFAKFALALTAVMLAMKAWSLASSAIGAILMAVQGQMRSLGATTASVTLQTRAFTYAKKMETLAHEANTMGLRLAAAGYRAMGIAAKWAGRAMKVLKAVLIIAAIEGVIWLIQKVKELKAVWKETAAHLAGSPRMLQKTIDKMAGEGFIGTWIAKGILDEAKFISLVKGVERMRLIEAEKRGIIMKASAKQASLLLQLGSKPFQDTINQLENLVKSKPKEFKMSDVVMAQNWLKKVSATPAGKMIMTPSGKRMEVRPAMISAAKNALALSQGAMATLMGSIRSGKGISTAVATQVAGAMKGLNLAVKGTVDPESKKLIKAGESPALAMLHQLKGPQIQARTARAKLAGVAPEIAPDWLLSKFAGMTQTSYLTAQRKRGQIAGEAPAPGAFLTDERRQLTQASAFERLEKAGEDSKVELEKLNVELKKIRTNIELVQKMGITVESKEDPGTYRPGLFAGGKM